MSNQNRSDGSDFNLPGPTLEINQSDLDAWFSNAWLSDLSLNTNAGHRAPGVFSQGLVGIETAGARGDTGATDTGEFQGGSGHLTFQDYGSLADFDTNMAPEAGPSLQFLMQRPSPRSGKRECCVCRQYILNFVFELPDGPQVFGYSQLHYLGFFVRDGITLPLFTDAETLSKDINLQSFFSQSRIALVGMVKPPSPLEATPFYSDAPCVDLIRKDLSRRCLRPVYVSADHALTCAVRVFELGLNDTQFQWESGRFRTLVLPSGPPLDETSPNAVVSGALESSPLVAGQRTVTSTRKRSRDEVTETIGPGPSTAKKIKSPDEAPKLTMGILELKFPELFALATYAKGYYRSQCLIKTPYLLKKDEKLILADESYHIGLTSVAITAQYHDPPSQDEITSLISAEHSVFRTNSIKLAKEVVAKEFPSMGPNAVDAATIAEMLRIAFLPDVADDFLALRIVPGSESDSEGSDSSDSEGSESSDSEGSEHETIVPLSHEMVGRLLHKLFNQKLRQCGNVSLRDRLRADFPNGKPLNVVTVAYVLSLLVDAIINMFRHKLLLLPVENFLPRRILMKDVDAFKFDFFLNQWKDYTRSEMWGPKMRSQLLAWRDLIFS